MKNMADAIESFIVGQLLAASKNTVMVQRNELADRLSCAPSQISYVLSTRFTPERIPPGQRRLYPYRQDIAGRRTAGGADCG